MMDSTSDKPLFWIGSSRNDLKDCPAEVQNAMGYALHWAQRGGKSPDAKPLQGFGGAGVLEVVDDFDGDTYRTVYTVRFMCFTSSRRNPARGLQRLSRTLS